MQNDTTIAEITLTNASEDGKRMIEAGGMQNMAWAADTSKFGFKMLQKMGWKAGQGIGKDLQGQAGHVSIKRRSENLGIGCSLKQAEVQGWSATGQGFVSVLETLNQTYKKSNADTMKKEEKKRKKEKKKEMKEKKREKKEKKAKKAKDHSIKVKQSKTIVSRRILYHKRIQNKNAKGYNAEDMTAILGTASTI